MTETPLRDGLRSESGYCEDSDMGFDLQSVRFLMEAKAQGVDFTDTLNTSSEGV